MNPLVQGWSTAHQVSQALPTWGTQPSVPQPSIYGALPYFTPEPIDPFVTYTFVSFGATVLNSALLGADNRTRFLIITDDSASTLERTTVEDPDRGRVALITWGKQPSIAIDELGWTMRTSQWLYLSSNHACRTMIVSGEKFSWRPNGGFIELFSLEGSDALARISQGAAGVVLQVAPKAIQKRLLKVIVTSTVLLMSGRKID
ncbi:hypothetical protein MVEN_01653300 [Mycena venus]|uniref:DUF6593 domain-containing protein n=1 Tax=Mycena venus TaxID=2733690 RepID=A0A8H6XQI0_9AGAR|nr:hypothetical protein MVEN_01653300 [Mycena venus]